MNDMKIVDMHCDTLLQLYMTGKGLDTFGGHINIDKLRRGGALLQCFAIFTPTGSRAKVYRVSESPWEYFQRTAGIYEKQLELWGGELAPMLSMEDLRRNAEAGKISAMLTLEDSACLDGHIERVEALYDRGVRLASLTWNYENSLGFPHSPEPKEHMRGLKPFGFDAVQRMEELGMVVDVSHLSRGGFFDVASVLKKPFAASHSCARALCDHSRNLDDEQLRLLGDRGCVCGVNFYSAFLREDSEYTANEDILRHMEYIANKAGIETLALGSDFDGIDCDLEMKDYAGMEGLSELIVKRFGWADGEKIMKLNALRLFSDVLG